MHVGIVSPAETGSLAGNRVTAERWKRMLETLGHEVSLETSWQGQAYDALIALHARRSADAAQAFDRERPDAPLVVALGGTDLYVDLPAADAPTLRSLQQADYILALQSRATHLLPEELHGRVVVMPQSADPLTDLPDKRDDIFEVAVVGHLREVKAPFLTAEASRQLPEDSRISIVHIGGVIDAEMEPRAIREMSENLRYRWMGSLGHDETRQVVARCRLLSHTSRAEGGANVISEALVLGVPVVGTRIDGTVGMLGEDYPGYVDVDDAEGLATLLRRAETDEAFYTSLREHCEALRGQYLPEAELTRWRAFAAQLEGAAPPGPSD